MAWNKFKSLAFILAAKYQKLEKTKNLPGILHIPGPNIRRPKTVTHEKGKEAAPTLSAEVGTENTASCMERYSDAY